MTGFLAASAVPVIAALIAVVTAAWLYHSVREHHVHLIIARKVNPRITVPPTRHDTMWHSMGHGRRTAVNAAMLGAAALLGGAWHLERTAATAGILIALAGAGAWLGARALSRAIGPRRGRAPGPGLED